MKRIAKDIKSSPYIPVTGAFIYSEKDNDPLNGYPLGFLPFRWAVILLYFVGLFYFYRPKLLRSKKTFFKGDPATNEVFGDSLCELLWRRIVCVLFSGNHSWINL